MVNLAWPRPAVYGGDHWYFQWGAFTFIGLLGASAPPTTWSSCAAARRRCWPSTGPDPRRRVARRRRARRSLTAGPWRTSPSSSAPGRRSTRWRPDELARIAAVTETEVSPRGKTIFAQGAGPVEYLRVVRSRLGRDHPRRAGARPARAGRAVRAGVDDLRAADRLRGPGGRGHGLLPHPRRRRSGRCWPAPDVLRFVARSIVGPGGPGGVRAAPTDPAQQPVAALIRTPPLLCPAGEPIREAAQRMTAEGASAVLVRAGGTARHRDRP